MYIAKLLITHYGPTGRFTINTGPANMMKHPKNDALKDIGTIEKLDEVGGQFDESAVANNSLDFYTTLYSACCSTFYTTSCSVFAFPSCCYLGKLHYKHLSLNGNKVPN